jgi:hypothetical protein
METKASSLDLVDSFLTSLGVEGWFWTGWVVSFDGFDCFLFLMIVGARNKLGSTLHNLVLTPLKANI